MHKNISGTIFYSLLFAMGGAPTIAMLIIHAQTKDPNIIYGVFISLTVIIACILVPLILIQNAFLFFKRKAYSEPMILFTILAEFTEACSKNSSKLIEASSSAKSEIARIITKGTLNCSQVCAIAAASISTACTPKKRSRIFAACAEV